MASASSSSSSVATPAPPRASGARGSASSPAPAPSAAAPLEKVSMRSANEEVDKTARKVENTMYTCLLALSNTATERLHCMMSHMTQPLEEAHSMEMTIHKTQAGLLEWHINMAVGDFVAPLQATFAQLQCESTLVRLGFIGKLADPESAMMAEETLMAEISAKLSRMLVAAGLQSLRTFCDRPPGKFAGLLHRDGEVRSKCLEWCRALYDAMTYFEEVAASGDRWVRDFLAKLTFTSNSWVRETLVALDEVQFQRVPGRCGEELVGLLSGLRQDHPGGEHLRCLGGAGRQELEDKTRWEGPSMVPCHQLPGVGRERAQAYAGPPGGQGGGHTLSIGDQE